MRKRNRITIPWSVAGAAVLAMVADRSAAAPTQINFGGYSWTQENAPTTGAEIISGTHGGATFNYGPDGDSTGAHALFATNVVGGTYDDNFGMLGVITGIEVSGNHKAGVNLPGGFDVGQNLTRRGLSVGWTAGQQGMAIPALSNGAGADFVIFEAGDSGEPDAMMVRARVTDGAGNKSYTPWYYAAPASQTQSIVSASSKRPVLHAYEYDLSDLGVAAGGTVDQIQIANMTTADRIQSNSGVAGGNTVTIAPDTANKFVAGGQFGGAREFDGHDDFGTFQSPLFDVGESGTLNFWVKMDNTGKRNQFFEGPGNAGLEFQYRTNGGGQFYGRAMDGGDFTIESGGSAAVAGAWTNLQFTWDAATSTMRIYENGTEVAYLAANDPILTGFNSGNFTDTINGLMNVGRDPGTPDRYFDGLMDDVGWFNAVLNQTDRDALRLTGVSTLAADSRLVAHWAFDEVSGDTATDSKNGIVMTFLGEWAPVGSHQSFMAEGVVLPEIGGAFAADNPGPFPGALGTNPPGGGFPAAGTPFAAYATFNIPFGNSTYDPDPLYLAPLSALVDLAPIVPEPASISLLLVASTALFARRRTRA